MYKQVKENWTKNKTRQNRGAYQSPLSWTSKPRILHVCKFPFRIVCVCVCVCACQHRCVCELLDMAWMGKEKWTLKM